MGLSSELILLLSQILIPLTILTIIFNDTICSTDLTFKENTSISNIMSQSSELIVLSTLGSSVPSVYFKRTQPRNTLFFGANYALSSYSYSLVLISDINFATNWTIILENSPVVAPKAVYMWPKTTFPSFKVLDSSSGLTSDVAASVIANTQIVGLQDSLLSTTTISGSFDAYPQSFWNSLKNLTSMDYTYFAYANPTFTSSVSFEFKNPLFSGCTHGGSTSFDKIIVIALIVTIILWICFISCFLIVIAIPIAGAVAFLLITGRGKKITNQVSRQIKKLLGRDKSNAGQRVVPLEQMKNEIEHSKPSSVGPGDLVLQSEKLKTPFNANASEVEQTQQHTRPSSLGPSDFVFQASKNTPSSALTSAFAAASSIASTMQKPSDQN